MVGSFVFTFHATPGKGAETRASISALSRSRAVCGCEQFEGVDVFDPDKLVLLELWNDAGRARLRRKLQPAPALAGCCGSARRSRRHTLYTYNRNR